MTNNEPSVKLPPPVGRISLNGLCMSGLVYTEYGKSLDLRDGTNFYTEEQVRAVIALNATGVDAQEKVEATLRDVLSYVGNRTDGDLITLAGRAEHWMRGSKSLIDMQLDLLRRSKPAPTGVYAADEVEYEYEVWQSDAWQAGGSCTDLDTARNEASHYALMYGQDGPVTVKLYEKREITAALAALAEGEKA